VFLGKHRIREAWLNPKDQIRIGESVVRIDSARESWDRELASEHSFGKLIGRSTVMRDLFEHLSQAAQTQGAVLLTGETGTGKELCAKALVEHGLRQNGPLVVVDCAGVSPSTIESELFGHERGAFTHAERTHIGAFERAHGGTLFLDEIGELPWDLQARLLGAIERKAIKRVGGSQWINADARVISATHRELPRMVNRGTFRADLYYRIAAITIHLPALRDHPEDIPGLVDHFLSELDGQATLAPLDLQQLYDAEYSGNVRELKNCVLRATMGLDWRPFSPSRSPEGGVKKSLTVTYNVGEPYRAQKDRTLDLFEREFLVALLRSCEGNISEAARRSGLDRAYMYALLRRRRVAPPQAG
jgi:DNA-binding NtrC family response regulator